MLTECPHELKKIFIIHNALSGNGDGTKRLQILKKSLTDNKMDFELISTQDMQKFLEFVENFVPKDGHIMLVCGGDGTIFLTVNAIAKSFYKKKN